MKHLQTFESYQMNEEEIFGLGKMFKSAKDKAMKKAQEFLISLTKENPEIAKKLDDLSKDTNVSEKDKKEIQAKSSQSVETIVDSIPPKAQAEIEASLHKVQERLEYELVLEKFDFKNAVSKVLTYMGFGALVVGFIKSAIGLMVASGAAGVGGAAAATGFGIAMVIGAVLLFAGFLISGKPWSVFLGIESQAQWQKKSGK